MNKVEVCLSPELIHLYKLEGKVVVVVDILRATSTMVAAIESGFKEIYPFKELEDCLAFKNEKNLIGAERNGKPVEGFDIGNSPAYFLENAHDIDQLGMTTTNGTLAIELSRASDEIVIGAFLNIIATSEYLKKQQKDVVVFCAGWKGLPNIEDTMYAGALIELLKEQFDYNNDNANLAHSLFLQNPNWQEVTYNADHVKRLSSQYGIKEDIDIAITEVDRCSFVVRFDGEKLVRI